MEIIEAKNFDDMSRKAANLISAQIIMKPRCVLGLATGASPIGVYRQLVEWYRKGDLDFSKVTTLNLDEYKGLPREHPQSYYHFMHEHLFSKVNIDIRRTYIPDGMTDNPVRACKDYNEKIKEVGGIDLQLLGLGHNGHIGFNEPGNAFEARTHLVNLADSTIQANKRFFASEADVPRQAYTMGIKNIMFARKIIVLVSGKDKAAILKEMMYGAISPKVQASVLQLHYDTIVVADKDALSEIKKS